MADKKTFSNLEKPENSENQMEKIGGPLALGAVITLLIIILIVFVIKIGSSRNSQDGGGDELQVNTLDPSSQLSEGTALFPLVSDNMASNSEVTEGTIDDTENALLPSGLNGDGSVALYNRDFLPAEDYTAVVQLLDTYFQDYESCDVTGLMGIVDYNGGTPVTIDELTARAEIVEAYQDLQCYIVEGMDTSSYVVYASYNIKFYNIETPAPTLTRFYVVEAEDGALHIYNGEISAKLNAFFKTVDEYESVRSLSDGVDELLQQACNQDERLKQLMEILYGPETDQEAGETS